MSISLDTVDGFPFLQERRLKLGIRASRSHHERLFDKLPREIDRDRPSFELHG